MKLCNIMIDGNTHLAVVTERGVVDAAAAGFAQDMDAVIAGGISDELRKIEADRNLPVVAEPVYANVVNKIGKILCVGLNYSSHIKGIDKDIPNYPVLFSKFADALVPTGTKVDLPVWETSYDYEAELVVVVGKEAWGVSEEEAKECIFGYTCGNDLSCRDPQMRSGQWLIGKTMPGFAPCGPDIVTADEVEPEEGLNIRSYVNGELRQDGSTGDMIFSCAKVISYASRYIHLQPGDLIFTGTPGGVAMEIHGESRRWLEVGDRVDVEIEGIGHLTSTMC